MTRSILLTGAAGLLGTWLRRTAPDDVAVTPLCHTRPVDAARSVQADLRDARDTERAFAAAAPDVVVHAAYAHDAPSIVDATRHVVAATESAGAELVFISTDAVFSGDGRTRAEDDTPDPIWDYGRSKVAAEQSTLASSAPTTVVRLPLLVSRDPIDHVTARVQGSAPGANTTWFHDELRQPAYASEVAQALWRLVGLDPGARAGCWHLPGAELLSRFEIASRTARALGVDPGLVHPQATPAAVTRPQALVLADDRARRAIGWSPTPVFTRDLGGT